MTLLEAAVEEARRADILASARNLGAHLKPIGGGEYAGPCLACGGVDRFSVSTRKQVWHCRGCAKGGAVVDLVMHVTGHSFVAAVAFLTGEGEEQQRQRRPAPAAVDTRTPSDEEARNRRSAARIVGELVPIKGTPGEVYLAEARKIDVDAIADVLERVDAIGWHPSIYFNEPEYPGRGDPPHPLHGQRFGCIIGVMTDPVTAALTGGISRTYLDDGCKILKAKTLGPAGIVRLSLDEDVLGGLHIAEGLETSLDAMARDFRPMWAMGSTAIMAKFPVLTGAADVQIAVKRVCHQRWWRAAPQSSAQIHVRGGYRQECRKQARQPPRCCSGDQDMSEKIFLGAIALEQGEAIALDLRHCALGASTGRSPRRSFRLTRSAERWAWRQSSTATARAGRRHPASKRPNRLSACMRWGFRAPSTASTRRCSLGPRVCETCSSPSISRWRSTPM
jgi:CHC2 zinc finger